MRAEAGSVAIVALIVLLIIALLAAVAFEPSIFEEKQDEFEPHTVEKTLVNDTEQKIIVIEANRTY